MSPTVTDAWTGSVETLTETVGSDGIEVSDGACGESGWVTDGVSGVDGVDDVDGVDGACGRLGLSDGACGRSGEVSDGAGEVFGLLSDGACGPFGCGVTPGALPPSPLGRLPDRSGRPELEGLSPGARWVRSFGRCAAVSVSPPSIPGAGGPKSVNPGNCGEESPPFGDGKPGCQESRPPLPDSNAITIASSKTRTAIAQVIRTITRAVKANSRDALFTMSAVSRSTEF